MNVFVTIKRMDAGHYLQGVINLIYSHYLVKKYWLIRTNL